MKLKLTVFIFLLFLIGSCSTKQKRKFDLIILNAQIVNVENGTVTPKKFIGIKGDTIELIGQMKDSDSYKSSNTVDAKNKYVMPGLWDNHVHFRGGDSLARENQQLLPLFLAYGVTTVKDAGGDISTEVMKWRASLKNGHLKGPTIFTSGPKLDGSKPAWEGSIKVETTEDIMIALDSLETIGADYVKMYDGNLSKENFYGIIKEAEKRGLKTTGHMPLSADFMHSVALGLDGSEHLYYVLKACSPKADSLTQLNKGYGIVSSLVDSYDPILAEKVFKKLASNNVFICPTNHIGHVLAEILDRDHQNDTLLHYIGEGIQKTYQRRLKSAQRAREKGNTMRSKIEKQFTLMVRPMYDAGVNLLAGSDCGPYNSFVYPGESIHEELKLMVKAGLTPQQALKTSFVNGPKFFDLERLYGSVEKGKMADLLILTNNPLEKIENLSDLCFVISRGQMYTKADLDSMLYSIR